MFEAGISRSARIARLTGIQSEGQFMGKSW